MARNQKLINYHTGKKTEMPIGSNVDYGEIVVRHNAETPELLIKIGDNSFGVFQASGAVQTAIGDAKVEIYNSATTFATNAVNAAKKELNSAINAVASNVETLSGAVSSITENYVTKTDFEIAQGKLFNSATTVASNDATTKANKAKNDAITAAAASATTLLGLIDGVDGRVDTVSGDLNTFKTDVADDIKNAKDSVYSSATTAAAADAKSKADTAYSSATTAAAASAETLNNRIEAVDGKVGTLSGNIESLETKLTNTINDKVARAYRYKGSCTYAELTGKKAEFVGEVWNVTDANGDFPAGTNYAWNGTEWDALGGSVDLSPYALKTEVTGATKNLQDKIDTVSASLETFKTDVANTYATQTGVTSNIATAKSEAIAAAAASADTLNTSIETVDGRVDTVSASLETFKTTVANTYATQTGVTSDIKDAKDSVYSSAVTAAAASAQTLQNNINSVNSSVTGLSASTVAIQGIANTAIQTASIVDKDTCKVSVVKEGTELQFSFENLVVDCGEF